MAGHQNKLSQFWQELKRRKVIYVITVYASAAFVIIELANNVVEPLNLPEFIPTIVILILVIGFPIAVLLSWIFDLTPKGVEKTKPIGEENESQIPVLQNRWKFATYISIVVIIGLIIFNVVGGSIKLRAGDIQSLVILPFDNFTGDDHLDYFVSGMHASLITDMGIVGGLQVKSRTSSNAFKEFDLTIPEIGSKLGADAALETAVMCLGDTICIQFRLLNTKGDEEQLWVAEYREEKSQILNLYHRITKQVASEMMVELTADEKQRLDKARTVDKEAYDAFLQSYQYWGDLSKESLEMAYEYLNMALEKDPDWAPLHAGMAMVWGGRMQMGQIPREIAKPKIDEHLQRAFELDPDFADSYFVRAVFAVWTDWEWEKGEQAFLKALTVNPSDVMSRIYYAHLLMILQRTDEALIHGKLAVELDPLNPLILALYSTILKGAGQHEESLEFINKALTIDPYHSFTLGQLERAYYNVGDYENSIKVYKDRLSNIFPEDDICGIDLAYNSGGYVGAYREILRLLEAGSKGEYRYPGGRDMPPGGLAQMYCRIGRYTTALDELEKGLAIREPNMPYIATNRPGLIELYDSSRFIAILEKMNLPFPKTE